MPYYKFEELIKTNPILYDYASRINDVDPDIDIEEFMRFFLIFDYGNVSATTIMLKLEDILNKIQPIVKFKHVFTDNSHYYEVFKDNQLYFMVEYLKISRYEREVVYNDNNLIEIYITKPTDYGQHSTINVYRFYHDIVSLVRGRKILGPKQIEFDEEKELITIVRKHLQGKVSQRIYDNLDGRTNFLYHPQQTTYEFLYHVYKFIKDSYDSYTQHAHDYYFTKVGSYMFQCLQRLDFKKDGKPILSYTCDNDTITMFTYEQKNNYILVHEELLPFNDEARCVITCYIEDFITKEFKN